MIDSDRIFKSAFAKALTEDGSQLALSMLKRQKAGESIDKTDRDEYIHQVLDSFTELQRIVENLDMAEIFMKSYSVSVAWKKEYDHNHYFTYHYEMWIMNAIRLYERLLILINSVYWLEIPHNEISYRVIAAHTKLENTPTLKILNKVHAALSELQGLKK